MRETERFVNDGYGWACKSCRAARAAARGTSGINSSPPPPDAADSSPRPPDAANSSSGAHALPRFFREGEAEEREARLAQDALARWKDGARRTLLCPRCGAEEEINAGSE
jgi:hypothetical protein